MTSRVHYIAADRSRRFKDVAAAAADARAIFLHLFPGVRAGDITRVEVVRGTSSPSSAAPREPAQQAVPATDEQRAAFADGLRAFRQQLAGPRSLRKS